MTNRLQVLPAGVLLLLLAIVFCAGAGRAQAESDVGAVPSMNEPEASAVTSPRVQTRLSKVESYDVPRQSASEGHRLAAYAPQCRRQQVTMQYSDGSATPFIKFTGTKKWCFDGYRVTSGGMDVTEAWIRPDMRAGADKDGYVYVPSGLKKTDRFLTYNGHANGAHESTRTGRFEYRFAGQTQPAQVLMPFVSRTARYNGTCDGPMPKDVAPRILGFEPANGATAVPASANVEVRFSVPMNPGTFNSGTFVLKKRGTFDEVVASYRYDAATKTATLDPRSPLTAGAVYTASVWNGPYGVKTAAGDPIYSYKTWSFTVAR